jgi:hypothetical protein
MIKGTKMSNSAKQQVQTVSQAMQAVDEKKGIQPEPTLQDILNKKPVRPKTIARGKGAGLTGSKAKLMFDSVPAGFQCARQIDLCIDAYFELLSDIDHVDGHELISVQDISDKADLIGEGYAQDGVEILDHYKLQIEGKKAWKYRQGIIKIGTLG